MDYLKDVRASSIAAEEASIADSASSTTAAASPNDASLTDAAAASATSKAAAAATKLGLGSHFLIGIGNDLRGAPDYNHDLDGAYTLGTTLDLHYCYLTGLQGRGGWPDWNANGSFVNIMSDSAKKHGVAPMFTLYAMAASGEDNMSVLTDDSYMGAYWEGAKLLFQRLAMFDGPAVVHFEPDWWGYAEQASHGDPQTLGVHVGSLASDCKDLPETMAGMGKCLVRLGRTYAPKAILGFHASRWAAPTPEAIASWLVQVGAGDADIIVTDMLDRDAGCFEYSKAHPNSPDPNCTRDDGPWYWDESNTTSPNFHEHLAWAKTIIDGVGKPMLWWQVPFGVPSDTPGGSIGHYRDNRVHYIFAHPDEFVAIGGLGAAFGTGAGNQTYITSDGNQFHDAVGRYFTSPTPLP